MAGARPKPEGRGDTVRAGLAHTSKGQTRGAQTGGERHTHNISRDSPSHHDHSWQRPGGARSSSSRRSRWPWPPAICKGSVGHKADEASGLRIAHLQQGLKMRLPHVPSLPTRPRALPSPKKGPKVPKVDATERSNPYPDFGGSNHTASADTCRGLVRARPPQHDGNVPRVASTASHPTPPGAGTLAAERSLAQQQSRPGLIPQDPKGICTTTTIPLPSLEAKGAPTKRSRSVPSGHGRAPQKKTNTRGRPNPLGPQPLPPQGTFSWPPAQGRCTSPQFDRRTCASIAVWEPPNGNSKPHPPGSQAPPLSAEGASPPSCSGSQGGVRGLPGLLGIHFLNVRSEIIGVLGFFNLCLPRPQRASPR
jgi:hypothetical protein